MLLWFRRSANQAEIKALRDCCGLRRGLTTIAPLAIRALGDARLALAILVLAILQQSIGHQNVDNSWLMTIAERVLDGKDPYVDFFEANPPASYLIYLPAVALAKLLGLRVEFTVGLFVFAGGSAAIYLTGVILRRANLLNCAELGFLLNAATFITLFIPGLSFAQREHFAIFAIMPILAVHCTRVSAASCRLGYAIPAGLLAGFAICIKPHFVLSVLSPLAFVLASRRSLRPLFAAENWAALCICLGYGLLLHAKHQAYFSLLPMLLDAYVSSTGPAWRLMEWPWITCALGLVCGVLLIAIRKQSFPSVVVIPLCAAGGFIVAFFVQGKGFPNHGLPCVIFGLLAACAQAAPAISALRCVGPGAPEWRALRLPIAFGLIPTCFFVSYIFGVGAQFAAWEEHAGLKDAILRLALPNPRLIAVSTQFHIGFPVVRQVNGVWVGRSNGLWFMDAAQSLLAQNPPDKDYSARLRTYVDLDARRLLEDVRAGRPDLILVDPEHQRTIRALRHPDVAAALEGYAPLDSVEGIWLWVRKP